MMILYLGTGLMAATMFLMAATRRVKPVAIRQTEGQIDGRL